MPGQAPPEPSRLPVPLDTRPEARCKRDLDSRLAPHCQLLAPGCHLSRNAMVVGQFFDWRQASRPAGLCVEIPLSDTALDESPNSIDFIGFSPLIPAKKDEKTRRSML